MSIATISNGENGASVRTKLNSLISGVNGMGWNAEDNGFSTTNTAAQNATAMTALLALVADGDTIFIPWKPEATPYLCNNVSITKRVFFQSFYAPINTTANTPIFTFTSTAEGSGINRIQFSGNSTGTSQGGVYFNGCGDFSVENCIIKTMGGNGIDATNTETSTNLGGKIINTDVSDCLVGFNSGSRAEYITVIGGIWKNTTSFKVAGGNNKFIGCNADYSGTGIEIVSGTNNAHGQVSHCSFNHCTSYGVNAHDTTLGMTFDGVHIYESPIRIKDTTGIKFHAGQIDVSAYTFDTNTDCTFNGVHFPNGYANTPSTVGTYPTFSNCTGTLPSGFDNNLGDWVDYSATSSITGWTSFTTKIVRYTLIGKMLKIAFSINGTSNATTISFTLPAVYTNLITARCRGCYAVDNGTALTGGGVAFVNTNSATVTIYKDWALNAGWTASGTKQIVGEIEFEVA